MIVFPAYFGAASRPTAASYTATPVNFDGTNDYLTRGAGMTGAVDSKLWTGSFWFRRTGTIGEQRIMTMPSSASVVFFVNSTNLLRFFSRDAIGNLALDINAGAVTDSDWHHVMWSFDQADTAKRHLYLDGVSTINVVAYANLAHDFTSTDFSIGANSVGTSKFNGDLADLQVWFGVYVDLSQAANRELFAVGGAPVDPAVAAAALGDPIIKLTGATDTWHINQGPGGGFTENGALTDGTGPIFF